MLEEPSSTDFAGLVGLAILLSRYAWDGKKVLGEKDGFSAISQRWFGGVIAGAS